MKKAHQQQSFQNPTCSLTLKYFKKLKVFKKKDEKKNTQQTHIPNKMMREEND